jgi:hypothetical protein
MPTLPGKPRIPHRPWDRGRPARGDRKPPFSTRSCRNLFRKPRVDPWPSNCLTELRKWGSRVPREIESGREPRPAGVPPSNPTPNAQRRGPNAESRIPRPPCYLPESTGHRPRTGPGVASHEPPGEGVTPVKETCA